MKCLKWTIRLPFVLTGLAVAIPVATFWWAFEDDVHPLNSPAHEA